MTFENADENADPRDNRSSRCRTDAPRQLPDLLLPAMRHAAAGRTGAKVSSAELEPLAAIAKRLRDELAWRASCFGRLQFFEPAWDLMLHLFIKGESDEPVDLASACRLVSMGRPAGVRWVGALETRGLIELRDRHAGDDARLILSDRGLATMTEYLSALR